MMKWGTLLIGLALIAALMEACDSEVFRGNLTAPTEPPPPPPAEQTFYLHFDYWNPDGNSPQISLDTVQTSPAVQYLFPLPWQVDLSLNDRVVLILEDIRLREDTADYEIREIISQEWQDGRWRGTSEFPVSFSAVADLDMVLVLDASLSLGNAFGQVKQFAVGLVRSVVQEIPSARIGVVDFATEVHTLSLTTDTTVIIEYIRNISQGEFTALYDAIGAGITLLASAGGNNRALVVFTDGNDNNSVTVSDPEELIHRLRAPAPGNEPIHTYMIGLQGNDGIDVELLRRMVTGHGVAAFPTSVTDLEAVFQRLADGISLMYDLTYTRSRHPISQPNARAVRFQIIARPR